MPYLSTLFMLRDDINFMASGLYIKRLTTADVI
jgi:hypothetical protein